MGIILLILIVCIALSIRSCAKEGSVQETSPPETELQKEVVVDGVSITGMSREEAREALLEHFHWGMKVTYQDQEYEVPNLMSIKIDTLLQEIYTGEAQESYTLDVSGLGSAVETEVINIAELWDKQAKNGEISGFDKSTGNFTYSAEEYGQVIDQQKLTDDIQTALQEKDFDRVIEASANQVAPEITQAQAKELYQVIGSFTTTTTANKDRNTNITIACEALDGLIIHPGEEFSFNQTTGNRTLEKGYKPAGAYVNGVLVEEPGGGVCQVSSTLYNAVIFSGLTTTERHAHSYEPSYVTPGEDAMVSYDGYSGPDMKFINKSSAAVAIRTSFVDRKLTISIVGIPILEEGVTLSMHSEKKMDLDPPEPTYEEDQTLEAGVEVVAKEAVLGSRWVTNLITKKDGVVVSDEFFHNSTYKGKAAIIKRNTSGVVIPDPSASASDGMSDGSGTDGGSLPGESSQEGDQIGPGIPTTAPETSTQAQEPGQSESSSAAESGGPGGENRQEQPQEPGSAPTVEAVDPHPMGSEE